ncbi:P-loop NTPase fold protein [Pseudoflavonifractor phocaeensis]|uniref:P-loop NTPase fold protein n=1 Tax=Pseudoflavonifractor phocaeensis TaxID=1870988 RepID=UPI00313EA5A1
MDTIDELLYYSREIEPVGALLLTGEWGCGKTHLIENEFKDAISDEAIVLRISLFSVSSPDEIHSAVKSAWMEAYCKIKGVESITSKICSGKKIVSKLDFLPQWAKGIASTDVSIFLPIGNTLDNKKVILVFDDLERCRMNIVDVLGVINEYCENQKYHTIIVANQEKLYPKEEAIKIAVDMQSSPTQNARIEQCNKKIHFNVQGLNKSDNLSIPYTEIKEKIIQRTVHYIPNYDAIVHTVIHKMKYPTQDYREFVVSCEAPLLELFAPDRKIPSPNENNSQGNLSRPHNIRSLKCAINDFYRVYAVLQSNNFPNLSNWLYSFVSYVIAYKADIAKEGAYGTLFTDEEVKRLYPAFHGKYIFNGVKSWILHGIWDDEAILHEIEFIKEREKAATPIDMIKTYRITDIDEEVVCAGFEDFLELAYKGTLSLDEYVLLIENSCWARSFEYTYPIPIDWNKIKQGISIQKNKLKAELPEGQILRSYISDEQKPYFTSEEWEAYTLISDFAFGNEFLFYKNRMLYIDKMSEYGASAFQFIQNKRFDMFDKEMAISTATAFSQENNYGKSYFWRTFKQFWTENVMSSDIKAPESLSGFCELKEMLTQQLKKLDEENKPISKMHTVAFIKSLNQLIEANS